MNISNYNAKNIDVLKGLEAVRKRPGMYIGSITEKGLHHLVWEILDNAVDESIAGFANTIEIILEDDGSISIADNGRGIPTEKHPKTNKSTVETVLTLLHAGGKFNNDAYKVSGGLHGVGASVVNALSEKLEVWVQRNNKIHYQQFINGGHPVNELKKIGQSKKTGTKIKFKPDFSIMEKNDFSFKTISERAKYLAYLNKNLKLTIEDKKNNLKNEFCFSGGIIEYVKELHVNKEKLHEDIIYAEGEIKNIKIEVAIQYNNSYNSNIISYVNNIITNNGGTHVQGFFDALIRILNNYATNNKIFKNEKEKLNKFDVQEGLTTVISIKHFNPIFEGQTKGKLGNKDARMATNQIFSKDLEKYFLENPKQAKMIIEKTLLAQRARFAAQKAKEVTRRKSPFDLGSLPGKLADCSSKNSEISELYIVEGKSAGGSAKLGRNREIQAILPLKGKVINSEKSRLDKVFANNEIGALITALGTGIGNEFNINNIRYHKIIIMTDADVDGSHIRTLLLTFFYRYLKPLIEYGFVYIAQPPLYKIENKKNIKYAFNDKEKEDILANWKGAKYVIQRYKGLGEMNYNQLWDTTMDPETRKMLQVQIQDVVLADATFSILMGENVKPRKEFINKNAKYAKINI